MSNILKMVETLYFETKCVLAVKDFTQATAAVLKIQKFCNDSNLKPYVIQMMDEQKTCALLLTKQNLTSKTAYYCSSSHLNSRRFGSFEVLMGNNVKRLLSKSDSKFFSRFSNLLQPEVFYTKQIDNNYAVKFSRSGSNGVKMSKIETNSRWRFESASQCYVIESEKPDLVRLASCKISPPNLMMNLWDAPEVARRYILEDIANGAIEDRDCKEGFFTTAPSKNTINVAGLGFIELDSEERTSCLNTLEEETDDSYKQEDSLADCSLDYDQTTIKQTIELLNSTEPKTHISEPNCFDAYYVQKQKRLLKSPVCFSLF